MALFLDLIKSLPDFLFPRSPRAVVLESLSTADLMRLLPPADTSEADTGAIALFDYRDKLVKEIIWEVKYSGNRALADKLGELLYDHIIQELSEHNLLSNERPALLIPAPVSDRRRFERGWNQAELLAAAVKRRDVANSFTYLPHYLLKSRHTESQTKTSSRSARLENLTGSMKVLNPLSVASQFIILIDDVATTGATFTEAKRALKDAGAKRVLCFAAAH